MILFFYIGAVIGLLVSYLFVAPAYRRWNEYKKLIESTRRPE
jgi:hypothetical protein